MQSVLIIKVVCTYNQSEYNIADMNMNMELLEALFRRHRNRGPQNFKEHHQLKEILEPIAHTISERASLFIKEFFQIDKLTKMKPLDWNYDITNPTQSPMCSKVMTEHSDESSFRCYDCMESSSSCMCQACFKDGNHQGHNYVQYTSVNGCCDCGNAEAWNEKGFCKTHTAINNLQIELSSSLKAKYVEEGTLLIYIYFYLCFVEKTQREEDIYLIEVYGKYIFNYFKRSSQRCYDMKLLGCCLLDSKIPPAYPKVIQEDLTILQIFFAIPQQKFKGYEELIHFFFELFPVEEHRKAVLINYFKKMKKLDQKMIKEYPLAGLNFQYLSCVKLINSLIKKGELEPLQVFAAKPYLKNNQNIEEIPEVYKKLYQDLDYVHNMKSAKQYEMLHLIKTNVADLAGYRQYSTVANKAKNRNLLADFNVDEMFIKMFAKFIKNLKDEKEVLIKSIQEIFHYIVNVQENYSSLAQERAFALLVLTYFQGDISQLASKQKKNQFIKEIYCTQEQLGMSLKNVIKSSLRTKINISKLKQPRRNIYESYFLRINCQKNVLEFLDCIFHKILILLSQEICSYEHVVEELLRELGSEEPEPEYNGDSDDEQNQVPSVCTKLQHMLVVLQLLNTVTLVDMDEFLVAGLVKIVNKPKIFAFFARIISTFKQLNVKQIKILCLQLMNNEQLFEQFIMSYTYSQKGKLKLKQAAKPLEYFNYNKIFQNFRFHLPESDMTYLKGQEYIDNVYAKIKMKVFNADTLQNIVQVCNEAIILLAEKADKRIQNAFNAVIIQLLKTQLNGSTIQKPLIFIEVLFNESVRVFLYKNVIQQMTILSKKEQQLHKDLQKIKVEEAEQFRLKRQKIMNKKKLKEGIMKRNQEEMLNKFKHIEEMKCQSNDKPICIYCKGEKKEEQLSLISYIGLTNLIEKSILKQPTFHYFFTTCGHYIHSSCYIQANTKEIKKYCFFCKQQSNILIPDFITFPQQKTKQKTEQFLSNILSVLVNEYDLADGKIGQYQTLIFENNEQILIESFAKELVYKGLHSYSYFKKNLYFLYLQIYEIIRFIDKEKINKYLQLPLQSEKEVTKLQMLVNYVQLKLLDMIPNEDYSVLQINQQEIEQANNLIDVIKNKKPDTEISELKQINVDSLFIKIPETLKELHMYMGKCKLCPNVTNNIFLCLNCGWSGCLKCSTQIFKHVGDEHLQGTAIMGCSTGSVKYVKQSLIFQDASIYENYLGLTFTDSDSYMEFSRAEKYNLNRQKQQQVKAMMLRYQVHQKIKLNAQY